MRPSYDAFGWLDWGRQTLHWDLNLDGAPSWKPLTFLFTFPYALAGPNPQVWLWMITATAAAASGPLLAGRIAYRLTGRAPGRPWARWVAAAFAGVGVLGLDGLSHLVLIANSDPMIVALCLAAIDCHLSGRRRLALLALLLAGYGRPEVWAFVVLYAALVWREEPAARPLAIASVLSLPAAWFIAPAIASHSWLSAGDLALGSKNVIHGNKIVGVIERLRNTSAVPFQLAVAGSLGLAIARRDRAVLTLFGAALLWVLIEIAFAYHGWSAVARYLLEPAAVLLVLGGTGIGWVLSWRGAGVPAALRAAPAIVPLALAVGLIPTARSRADIARGEIEDAGRAAKEMSRLEAVISAAGGAAKFKACGHPVSLLGKQSEVAWALGVSVGEVGFRPGADIHNGVRIVLLKPHDLGWQVRPYNTSASCRSLDIDSEMG
jgi:hypothetical protein